MLILTPGLYALQPLLEIDEDANVTGRFYPLNPAKHYNTWNDTGPTIELSDEIASGTIVASPDGRANTFVIGLDFDDRFSKDLFCTSINSPLGPLSICDAYVLMPVDSRDINSASGGQDAINWLVLDIASDTSISVDGGRIIVDDVTLDVAAGPDLESYPSSTPVKAGTELHKLIMGMMTGEDDSVFALLSTDEAGVAAVEALSDPAAIAVAQDLRTDEAKGFLGTIMHFEVDGPRIMKMAA